MGKELQKRKERRGNTLHVDVNRLKGKTVERGMTGEEMQKSLESVRAHIIENWAVEGLPLHWLKLSKLRIF